MRVLYILFFIAVFCSNCSDQENELLIGSKWKLIEFDGYEVDWNEYAFFHDDYFQDWFYNDYYHCYEYYKYRFKIDGNLLLSEYESVWDEGYPFILTGDTLTFNVIYDKEYYLSKWIPINFSNEELNDDICDNIYKSQKRNIKQKNR